MNARLIGAEILKLRKRRGLMIVCALITFGLIAVVDTVLIVMHAVNPDKHGPAGGIENFGAASGVLAHLASVAAVLIGATAGAGDLGAGVFRELVVTGRSRLALFVARLPGGLAVLWTFVLVAYAAAVFVAYAFAGSSAKPSLALVVEVGLWLLLNTGFYYVLALGFASLVGSRSTAIAVLLAFRLLVAPILASISLLGEARKAVPIGPLDRLVPARMTGDLRQGPDLRLSLAAAVIVLAVWIVVSLGAGAWRTQTRDA